MLGPPTLFLLHSRAWVRDGTYIEKEGEARRWDKEQWCWLHPFWCSISLTRSYWPLSIQSSLGRHVIPTLQWALSINPTHQHFLGHLLSLCAKPSYIFKVFLQFMNEILFQEGLIVSTLLHRNQCNVTQQCVMNLSFELTAMLELKVEQSCCRRRFPLTAP